MFERLTVGCVLVALGSTACAHRAGTGDGGGIAHPTAAGQLVLRVESAGGLLPPTFTVAQVPGFSLFGDGTVVVTGVQTEIFPGPAMGNLIAMRVTEAGVQRVLREAGDAGLLGPDRSFVTPTIADAPTTTFTVVAEGRRHVTAVYALGMETGPSGTPAEAAARRRLASFATRVQDLRGWLPAADVGPEQPYDPPALRVFVRPGPPPNDQGLRQVPVDWPLATALASFGEAVTVPDGSRCGVVQGADLSLLLPRVRGANQLTSWKSQGAAFTLTFRPMLPDESGCS